MNAISYTHPKTFDVIVIGGGHAGTEACRKGAAVRATRAQADRILYKAAIRHTLENQPNLTIFQQSVDDIIVENTRAVAVVTATGIRLSARAVVLTAGTFLGGVIHVG